MTVHHVYPFCRTEMPVVSVTVDRAPAVETFLGAYAYKAAYTTTLFLMAKPLSKQFLKVIIP